MLGFGRGGQLLRSVPLPWLGKGDRLTDLCCFSEPSANLQKWVAGGSGLNEIAGSSLAERVQKCSGRSINDLSSLGVGVGVGAASSGLQIRKGGAAGYDTVRASTPKGVGKKHKYPNQDLNDRLLDESKIARQCKDWSAGGLLCRLN